MGSRRSFLILEPFQNVTFDHKRDILRIEYLINDCHNQMTEAELSHLNDILHLHGIETDYIAGNIDSFKA
jgi:hypothetical protein